MFSDNGPQYTADKSREFTAEWDIERCRDANGKAECYSHQVRDGEVQEKPN